MKPITKLISQASTLISEISHHPEYEALLDKGYSPEFDLAEVQIALVCLSEEVVKDLKQRLILIDSEANEAIAQNQEIPT